MRQFAASHFTYIDIERTMNAILGLTVLLIGLCYTNAASPLLGGWSNLSVDDAKVVELSNWAVETIGNGYALREIKKAEYQVNFN